MSTSKMIKCQICGASLRKQRMEAHIENVHTNPGGGQVFTARSVTASTSSAKRPETRKVSPAPSTTPVPPKKSDT